jgi:hypothetical protein
MLSIVTWKHETDFGKYDELQKEIGNNRLMRLPEEISI